MEIRLIKQADDRAIAEVIRATMTELGIVGPGASQNDPAMSALSKAYSDGHSAYFVVVDDFGEIVGGAGIASMPGVESTICELQKMYLRPSVRGRGLGRALLERCLDEARRLGFRSCYLESMNVFKEAIRLYESKGFVRIPERIGNTGHIVDLYYRKEL